MATYMMMDIEITEINIWIFVAQNKM